ncbi:hypothetical protein C4573_06020 [Candidatus Woesearchaeota archaeon]|nr:MAG: hypothetical protein C4573_06020 [Candidatus Woesearchaeota archaeon]
MDDLAKTVDACAKLDLKNAALGPEFYYKHLPLCVIDAVFSMGVRYAAVQKVVDRYCDSEILTPYRDTAELPDISAQENISQFAFGMRVKGIPQYTEDVFKNKQRTSTRNGILKGEAVYLFACALEKEGILYLQDAPLAIQTDALRNAIQEIPGQKSGLSLDYFFMLAGSDDFIKADRLVRRFLENALGKPVSVADARILLSEAVDVLVSAYPAMTPRLLDHTIWKYQRQTL